MQSKPANEFNSIRLQANAIKKAKCTSSYVVK